MKLYVKKNKYHDKNIKYHGIETIRYLFEDYDEDFNLYYQQYQSFSNKNLLPLNKYLQKIRSELIKIMNKKSKVTVNTVFRSKKDRNDKTNVCINSKNTTGIDEIFSQIIKKHDDLIETLKEIDFMSEGVESMTYTFSEIVTMNTFFETPEWLALKRCVLNPQNN